MSRPRFAPLDWLSFAVALFVLNFALSFHNIWPTLWVTTRHELSVEIAALVVAMILVRAFWGPLRPAAIHAAAAVVLVMTIGRYAEVTAPALYGRPVNIYWDAKHLPAVAAMLAEAASPLTLGLLLVGVVGLLAGVYLLLSWALRRLGEALEVDLCRRSLGILAGGLVAFYLLGYTSSVDSWRWFSLPVSTTYWRQAQFVLAARRESREPVTLPASPPIDRASLDGVNGADVIVMFVESYGATAFDSPSVAAPLAEARQRLASAIERSGRGAVSAFVESPTFGGNSWLAHASFMTGIEVREPRHYDLLLTQERPVLSKRFGAAGYRVVALMPGLKQAWPEGAFYGFETIYGAEALDYRGPEFGWWSIPDQFALARLESLELAGAERAPVFAFFTTISTHMPFRPTPPYQPDWSRIASSHPYDAPAVEASLAQEPEWTNLLPAYTDTLTYTFDYLAGFLSRQDADLVLLLLGDHQPPAIVSGQDARWDVPVHVVASRRELLASLERAGFSSGLLPSGKAVAPMHGLTDIVLDALASR